MRRFFLYVFSILLMGGNAFLRGDETGVGPNLLSLDFENGTSTSNPWAGVDDAGNLRVWTGEQLAVDDGGKVGQRAFSPSVAVGDLNGDGLPDLVVADPRGFFWFFPNSGKPDAPAFTHGEIIPVWVGATHPSPGAPDEYERECVPKIQLVDTTGKGLLDLVIGNYIGGLYIARNHGSPTAPNFSMPGDRAEIQIPTHRDNFLWCNHLAPFLFDWSGTGRLDLLIGEGSYSANSIYLLTNMGDNSHFIFNEDHRQKLIPGMGREQLTPQVVDWNNDGKPDIIAGERAGYIDIYLNQAASKSAPPVFDKDNPQHVKFGGVDKITSMPTVCAADLNHDGLFDLIVGSPDGKVSYSINTGKLGAPEFGPLVAVKGINPYPSYLKSSFARINNYRPSGEAYGLLECVNNTTDPSFTPPPDSSSHGALKYSIFKPSLTYFKDAYVPVDLIHELFVLPSGQVPIPVGTRYIFSAWVRADGDVNELGCNLVGLQYTDDTPGHRIYGLYYYSILGSVGNTWTRIKQDIIIESQISDNPEKKQEMYDFHANILYKGQGSFYITDISLKPAK